MAKKTIIKPKTDDREAQYYTYRCQFDFRYGGTFGPKNSTKSETVPVVNLTIRQLIAHHTVGANDMPESKVEHWFDTEIPVIKDILDIKDYAAKLQKQVIEVNKIITKEEAQHKADIAKATKAQAQAKADKEYLDARKNSPTQTEIPQAE